MTTQGRDGPNFDGIYGITANPMRLMFMMGTVWYLARDGHRDRIDILEVGSWVGRSALVWGEAIQLYFGGAGTITCVDAWEPFIDLDANPDGNTRAMDDSLRAGAPFDVFTSNMRFLPETVALEVRRGWSRDVLPALAAESCDLIYLDGDHSYAAVAADIANSMPLLRDGGILCGDDLELQAHACDLSILEEKPTIDQHFDAQWQTWFHPGVTKAVAETFGPVSSWYGFWAVKKAGDEWWPVSLDGMPARIPSHLHQKSLMGLKAFLTEHGLI